MTQNLRVHSNGRYRIDSQESPFAGLVTRLGNFFMIVDLAVSQTPQS